MTTCLIRMRVSIPGTHCWPDASCGAQILAHEHRHVFYVTVTKTVPHMDRESEFFAEQARIYAELHKHGEMVEGLMRFGSQSCEQLATNILLGLNDLSWQEESFAAYRSVIVSEDNENEAEVQA